MFQLDKLSVVVAEKQRCPIRHNNNNNYVIRREHKAKQLNPLKYDRVAFLAYVSAHIQSGRKNCSPNKVVLQHMQGVVGSCKFTQESSGEAISEVDYDLI